MSYVTHMDESSHTQMIDICVMSQLAQGPSHLADGAAHMCHTHERIMSHTGMSHVAHINE